MDIFAGKVYSYIEIEPIHVIRMAWENWYYMLPKAIK